VIRYKQEAFMKKYIEKNAKLRAESKTDFEKYKEGIEEDKEPSIPIYRCD
jgi:hypothetical protein